MQYLQEERHRPQATHPNMLSYSRCSPMSDQLKTTSLHPTHTALDAQMIDFAGWEMPAQYKSAVQEHRAVRTNAGMFDVSHMGRLYIEGEGGAQLLDRVLTANVLALEEGQAKYCLVCREDGGVLDDIIVYRLSAKRHLIVPNASNREQILAALHKQESNIGDVAISDRSRETAMIAFQGPRSLDILKSISSQVLSTPSPFRCIYTDVQDTKMLVARTGYTGEDGVELIMDSDAAPRLWQALTDAGAAPCGLVARDSLRLEAALRLYGNDMDTTTNPYEVGLGRFVDLDKGDFVGKETLARVKVEGVSRRLAGFEMVGRGVPRHGFSIIQENEAVGQVTSGGFSPTLNKNIGLGFVPSPSAKKGTELSIDIRGRRVEAKVVPLPFYRLPKSA